MKRFLKINDNDKEFVKMTNQTNKGFVLVILSDKLIKEYVELINSCEKNHDEIYLVWQMKFKKGNYILYRNCKFSQPIDNVFVQPVWFKKPQTVFGKKFNVTCSGVSYYSKDNLYINDPVINPDRSRRYRYPKPKTETNGQKYNNIFLLERLLKLGEINKTSIDE